MCGGTRKTGINPQTGNDSHTAISLWKGVVSPFWTWSLKTEMESYSVFLPFCWFTANTRRKQLIRVPNSILSWESKNLITCPHLLQFAKCKQLPRNYSIWKQKRAYLSSQPLSTKPFDIKDHYVLPQITFILLFQLSSISSSGTFAFSRERADKVHHLVQGAGNFIQSWNILQVVPHNWTARSRNQVIAHNYTHYVQQQ